MNALLCGLASPGLLFPLIGIAEQLREQAVSCSFVTGAEFGGLLAAHGFARIARGAKDGPSFEIAKWAWPAHVAMQVKHIEYALDAKPADVLVTNQLGLGAMIVAERRRIPLVVVGLASYLYPTAGAAYDAKTADRKNFNLNETLRHLNAARALFGYPAVDGVEALLGEAFLVQSVDAAFQTDERLPRQVRNVGALLWEPPSELDRELAETVMGARRRGREIYFVQMARSFNQKGLWPLIVAALGREPATFVAATSRLDDEIGTFPPNFVVRDMVPLSAILPHVDAVVTGGHTTSVLAAVVHGRPMLSVPTGSGTYDTADLCARLRNAVIVDGVDVLADPATFDAAFDTLRRDGRLRAAAASAKLAFACHDPFGEAAAVVVDAARQSLSAMAV